MRIAEHFRAEWTATTKAASHTRLLESSVCPPLMATILPKAELDSANHKERWLMRSYIILAVWTLLAGAGIPLIGVLNSGLARSVGNPFTATAIMFAIAMAVALAISLPLYGAPALAQLGTTPALSYAGGLLIGFYALSATIIIPRFGAASFIAFILVAQLLTSAIVDQFGLFGMTKRPLDVSRLVGLVVIVAGIAIMEIGNLRKADY